MDTKQHNQMTGADLHPNKIDGTTGTELSVASQATYDGRYARTTGATFTGDVAMTSPSTTSNPVSLSVATLTTGKALNIANADALTTGSIAALKSNSADTSTRTLVDIQNVNNAASGTIPLAITQAANKNALVVTQNGNASGAVEVIQNAGNGNGLYVHSNANIHGSDLAYFKHQNTSDGGTTLRLDNLGNSNAGIALKITRTGNSASDVIGSSVTVTNAGTGSVVGIDFSAMVAGKAVVKVVTDATVINTTTTQSTGRIAIKDGSGTVRYIPYY